jgi:hypothetical protein
MAETWVGPRDRSILSDEQVERMTRITEMQRARAALLAKREQGARKESE